MDPVTMAALIEIAAILAKRAPAIIQAVQDIRAAGEGEITPDRIRAELARTDKTYQEMLDERNAK